MHKQNKYLYCCGRMNIVDQTKVRAVQDNLGSKFKITIELGIALAWIGVSIGLWWADNLTGFSQLENIIITIALGILDLLIIMMIHLFRRFSEVIKSVDYAKERSGVPLKEEIVQRLNTLTIKVYEDKLEYDSRLVRSMADQSKYLVDRGEWYLETSRLCRSMHGMDGEIVAISAFNIKDFISDENAKKYLNENIEAINNGIQVRRLFIIDSADQDDRDIRYVLNEHGTKLKPPSNCHKRVIDSGVKWILGKYAGEDKGQDFALFYPYVVVRQRVGGRQLEVCQQQVEIFDAYNTFERLWKKQTAQTIDKLPSSEKSNNQ